MNYLIKNATLVNEGQTFVASVFVSDGKIAKIVREGQVPEPVVAEHGRSVEGSIDSETAFRQVQRPSVQVIDAQGKYLIPGIIDEHVHFREPGLTYKADIYTESHAAVAGGVTSFMDMPNTIPQTTTQDLLQEKFDLAAEKSAQGDRLVERPGRRAVHDVALAEVAELLVRLVADILLRNDLVLAVGKPLEIALYRGRVLVAERDDLDAGNHRNAMDGSSAALPHADKADADVPALEFLVCVVLHLSALAEAEAVHLAAGGHGRSAHPGSSLEEITTIHVCFHMATTFREE